MKLLNDLLLVTAAALDPSAPDRSVLLVPTTLKRPHLLRLLHGECWLTSRKVETDATIDVYWLLPLPSTIAPVVLVTVVPALRCMHGRGKRGHWLPAGKGLVRGVRRAEVVMQPAVEVGGAGTDAIVECSAVHGSCRLAFKDLHLLVHSVTVLRHKLLLLLEGQLLEGLLPVIRRIVLRMLVLLVWCATPLLRSRMTACVKAWVLCRAVRVSWRVSAGGLVVLCLRVVPWKMLKGGGQVLLLVGSVRVRCSVERLLHLDVVVPVPEVVRVQRCTATSCMVLLVRS